MRKCRQCWARMDGNNSFLGRGYRASSWSSLIGNTMASFLTQLNGLPMKKRSHNVTTCHDPELPIPLAPSITHDFMYDTDINLTVSKHEAAGTVKEAKIVVVDDDELYISLEMKEIADVPPERRQAVYTAIYKELRGLVSLGTFEWAPAWLPSRMSCCSAAGDRKIRSPGARPSSWPSRPA